MTRWAICPQCGAEYFPHVARCADCDVALIPDRGDGKAKPVEPAVPPPPWGRLVSGPDPAAFLAVTSALEAAGIPFKNVGPNRGGKEDGERDSGNLESVLN
jgi:hypothetical protein